MVVNMSLINMGGKYKLVLATQYFFCQLHPHLMGFLWQTSLGIKGLDQVRNSLANDKPQADNKYARHWLHKINKKVTETTRYAVDLTGTGC